MWHDYPYTDAHELNLDWFLKEFKTLVETWEQVQSDWNSLHDYVQNYFDNLDVQTEIDNKINAMIADGSFALILTPLVEAALPTIVDGKLPAVVASQIGAVVASQIGAVVAGQLPAVAATAAAQEVGTWLAAHIDPDTGYVIDKSLTVSDAAADANVAGYELASRLRVYTNLYNQNDVVTGGYYRSSNGTFVSNSAYISTALIPVKPNTSYRSSEWNIGQETAVTFWDENEAFISGENSQPYGYTTTPPGCAYLRFPILNRNRYDLVSFCVGTEKPPASLPYNIPVYLVYNKPVQYFNREVEYNYDFMSLVKTGSETGLLRADGTIDGDFTTAKVDSYDVSDFTTIYISGSGYLNWAYAYYCLYDENDILIDSFINGAQTTLNRKLVYCENASTIKVNSQFIPERVILKDEYARANVLPNQWAGKVWYCYGTSISNTNAEGKYPTYLEQMSGMTRVNKGISGGGIGDLGAYSHGQVYDAICNTTDGKTAADLITLETGANDTGAAVPLGTIYDTGRTTLAGCLNDCIRYLQANTDAQIVIMNSPATTTEPQAANKYYEWAAMVEEICNLNRVHFVNNNCNLGYGKISGPDGADYVVDNIHQTNLGGYVMAENIWYQLRNIPVFRTSIPT